MDSRIGKPAHNRKDKVGNRYGMLVVIGRYDTYRTPSGKSMTRWLCRCDCGTEKVFRDPLLRKGGGSRSCGCQRDLAAMRSIQEIIKPPDPESPYRRLFREYRSSAKQRGYEFHLDMDVFKRLIGGECVYCGAKPAYIQKTYNATENSIVYNGIDRVNNEIGYVESNCVPCCRKCNLAKRDMTYSEFISWIAQAYNHLKRTGQIK